MLTAVLKAPRSFAIVERPVPRLEAGEVLVRTAATAVCHTDLDMYLGHAPGTKYPVVLGHESTGTIETVAPDVKHLQPGQNVIINPIIACGDCDQCRRGARNLCRNGGIFGREVEGSLNQFVRLDARYTFPLPDTIQPRRGNHHRNAGDRAPCPRARRRQKGERVIVLGQGTLGLLHTRLAVLAGADVIGVTRTKWKLDMATRMGGAGHTVGKSADAAIDDVLRLTAREGADVVIDTAGGAHALRPGVEMLKPGGRFLSFSLSHVPAEGFTAFPLYYGELTIIGSRGLVDQDMQPSIDLVASGRIGVADFITATYPLRDTAAAFRVPDRGSGNPTPSGGMGSRRLPCRLAEWSRTNVAATRSGTASITWVASSGNVTDEVWLSTSRTRRRRSRTTTLPSPESAGRRTDPALSRNLKPPPFRRWSIHGIRGDPGPYPADCHRFKGRDSTCMSPQLAHFCHGGAN